jgi:hypothetical protein
VGLDQISAIVIEDAELTITTARGDFELACWDVFNVFLVLDAVLTRGGTITLESDVYLPPSLSARLGS